MDESLCLAVGCYEAGAESRKNQKNRQKFCEQAASA